MSKGQDSSVVVSQSVRVKDFQCGMDLDEGLFLWIVVMDLEHEVLIGIHG